MDFENELSEFGQGDISSNYMNEIDHKQLEAYCKAAQVEDLGRFISSGSFPRFDKKVYSTAMVGHHLARSSGSRQNLTSIWDLLETPLSEAFRRDNRNMFPIHVACRRDSKDAFMFFKELMKDGYDHQIQLECAAICILYSAHNVLPLCITKTIATSPFPLTVLTMDRAFDNRYHLPDMDIDASGQEIIIPSSIGRWKFAERKGFFSSNCIEFDNATVFSVAIGLLGATEQWPGVFCCCRTIYHFARLGQIPIDNASDEQIKSLSERKGQLFELYRSIRGSRTQPELFDTFIRAFPEASSLHLQSLSEGEHDEDELHHYYCDIADDLDDNIDMSEVLGVQLLYDDLYTQPHRSIPPLYYPSTMRPSIETVIPDSQQYLYDSFLNGQFEASHEAHERSKTLTRPQRKTFTAPPKTKPVSTATKKPTATANRTLTPSTKTAAKTQPAKAAVVPVSKATAKTTTTPASAAPKSTTTPVSKVAEKSTATSASKAVEKTTTTSSSKAAEKTATTQSPLASKASSTSTSPSVDVKKSSPKDEDKSTEKGSKTSKQDSGRDATPSAPKAAPAKPATELAPAASSQTQTDSPTAPASKAAAPTSKVAFPVYDSPCKMVNAIYTKNGSETPHLFDALAIEVGVLVKQGLAVSSEGTPEELIDSQQQNQLKTDPNLLNYAVGQAATNPQILPRIPLFSQRFKLDMNDFRQFVASHPSLPQSQIITRPGYFISPMLLKQLPLLAGGRVKRSVYDESDSEEDSDEEQDDLVLDLVGIYPRRSRKKNTLYGKPVQPTTITETRTETGEYMLLYTRGKLVFDMTSVYCQKNVLIAAVGLGAPSRLIHGILSLGVLPNATDESGYTALRWGIERLLIGRDAVAQAMGLLAPHRVPAEVKDRKASQATNLVGFTTHAGDVDWEREEDFQLLLDHLTVINEFTKMHWPGKKSRVITNNGSLTKTLGETDDDPYIVTALSAAYLLPKNAVSMLIGKMGGSYSKDRHKTYEKYGDWPLYMDPTHVQFKEYEDRLARQKEEIERLQKRYDELHTALAESKDKVTSVTQENHALSKQLAKEKDVTAAAEAKAAAEISKAAAAAKQAASAPTTPSFFFDDIPNYLRSFLVQEVHEAVSRPPAKVTDIDVDNYKIFVQFYHHYATQFHEQFTDKNSSFIASAQSQMEAFYSNNADAYQHDEVFFWKHMFGLRSSVFARALQRIYLLEKYLRSTANSNSALISWLRRHLPAKSTVGKDGKTTLKKTSRSGGGDTDFRLDLFDATPTVCIACEDAAAVMVTKCCFTLLSCAECAGGFTSTCPQCTHQPMELCHMRSPR